jgi:hypothetical protein
MGFVWFSELTAIISLHSVNQFIVLMETCCVFFEVRTELCIFNTTQWGKNSEKSNQDREKLRAIYK